MVFEPQENYDVDITGENEYNSYIVERKKETRKYVYKRIQKQDYARLQHGYDTNREKYTKGIDVIDFPECSYIYNNTGENIELLSKFKGSQKFIEEVKKNVKDVFNGSSKGLDSYLKSLRSKRNKNNINNAISGGTANSEYGSRQNIANGGQRREDYIAKSNSNNVNSIQRKLKNSEQSSFSLSEKDGKYEIQSNSRIRDENGTAYYINDEKKENIYFRFDEKDGFKGKEHKSGVVSWEDIAVDIVDGDKEAYYLNEDYLQELKEKYDKAYNYIISEINKEL